MASNHHPTKKTSRTKSEFIKRASLDDDSDSDKIIEVNDRGTESVEMKAREQQDDSISPPDSKLSATALHHQESMLKVEYKTFCMTLLVIEVTFLILYAIWFDYDLGESGVSRMYSYFRDVNVMIFFGFGFLMTFLRRYGYSAIGYTFLISAVAVQWSILLQGFFETVADDVKDFKHSYHVGIIQLLNGLFCAGAVMISYGGVLGKVSPTQLLIMGVIEPMFYWLNIYVIVMKLEALDIGGGMTIHTFGAYFGLAVTWFVRNSATRGHKDNCSSYNSDIFSFAGTIFLWIMWPSFNAAVAREGDGELRALSNTFISITSSVISAFLVSRLVSDHNKIDVVHIQNATLAGGVAMGVAADLNVTLAGAMACGFVVGAISVLGYRFLTPLLSSKFGIQDVCGIHNLHGMPGVCSGLIGVFVALGASHNKDPYGGSSGFDTWFPRKDEQAGYQMAALCISIGFGIAGGLITGFLMKLTWKITFFVKEDFFNDRTYWHLPSDYDNIVDARTGEEHPNAHAVGATIELPA